VKSFCHKKLVNDVRDSLFFLGLFINKVESTFLIANLISIAVYEADLLNVKKYMVLKPCMRF